MSLLLGTFSDGVLRYTLFNKVDRLSHSFLKGQTRSLFVLFSFFSHDNYIANTVNDKSVDGVLGTRTRGSRMVGADDSNELWRPS